MAHPARATHGRTVDDLPTLRLVTLRRQLAALGPPLVFEITADIASAAAGLRASRTSATGAPMRVPTSDIEDALGALTAGDLLCPQGAA